MGVVEEEEDVDNKSVIVKNFLDVSKKYNFLEIPVIKLENNQEICDNCSKNDFLELDGYKVCTSCGFENSNTCNFFLLQGC